MELIESYSVKRTRLHALLEKEQERPTITWVNLCAELLPETRESQSIVSANLVSSTLQQNSL